MKEIRDIIEEIMDDVDMWRNKCANKYFNMLRDYGIEDKYDDVACHLFDELMDGFDDVDEVVKIITELKANN